jgi:hypothetical protein
MTRHSRPLCGLVLSSILVVSLGTAVPAAATPAGAAASAAVPAGAAPAAAVPAAPPAAEVTEVAVELPDAPSSARAAAPAPEAPTVDATESDHLVADLEVAPGRRATPVVDTSDAQTLGVTWPEPAADAALDVEVRVLDEGRWSAWTPLEAGAAPDAGSVDAEHATRAGTESMWLGGAEAVQVSFADTVALDVGELALTLVGDASPADGSPAPGGTSAPSAAPSSPAPSEPAPSSPAPSSPAPSVPPPASPTPTAGPTPATATAPAAATTSSTAAVRDRAAATASRSGTVGRTVAQVSAPQVATAQAAGTQAAAAGTAPRVISRAEWGAPAQTCRPDVASGLVGAVVHHTAGSNGYGSVAEAMQQLRNDAAYHIQSRGWCDIGYNFVVDKWGNIYEGRAGSMTEAVVGVHAGGFNTGTVGVSMLGTYDAAPPLATQVAVGRIIGWRLGAYRVDPRGTMSYATGTGENSRFQNQTVTLPRVIGHRDVSYTSCPGNGGYAALAAIRNTAWDASVESWSAPPSSLLRTSADATVYLVSGGQRHPITSMAVLQALSPLGPVAFVAPQYLAAWTVGSPVKRVLLEPDGTVSFFDAGIRLSFGSCAQVQDFGLDCADAIRIDAAQTAALHYGGRMTNLYRTTNGKAFYVTGGTRREVADDRSLAEAGLPSSAVWLLESGISYLPYGTPVVRTGLQLHERGGTTTYKLASEGVVAMPDALTAVPRLVPGSPIEMDAASLARLHVAVRLEPFIRRPSPNSGVIFLSSAGAHRVVDWEAAPQDAPIVPAYAYAGVPDADLDSIYAPFLLKGADDGTVSVVRQGRTRGIRSWTDLVRLAGTDTPTILEVPGAMARLLPQGPLYDPPGTLVKTAGDGTVHMLDGEGHRVTVSTFAVTAELGATRLVVVPDAEIAARAPRDGVLRTIVACGDTTYVGLGGRLWPVASADRVHFPAGQQLDPATCAALPRSDRPAPRFWRTVDGTIYQVVDGTKRPIGSMARYEQLGGTPATTLGVSDFAASQLRTGPRL